MDFWMPQGFVYRRHDLQSAIVSPAIAFLAIGSGEE
jgi:hypothetical protein